MDTKERERIIKIVLDRWHKVDWEFPPDFEIDWIVKETIKETRTSFREIVQGRIDELDGAIKHLNKRIERTHHNRQRLSDDKNEFISIVRELKAILASLDGEDKPK